MMKLLILLSVRQIRLKSSPAMVGLRLDDAVGAEMGPIKPGKIVAELRNIIGRGRVIGLGLVDRHEIVRHTGRNRLAPRDALDAGEQTRPHVVGIAAHRDQQPGLVRE